MAGQEDANPGRTNGFWARLGNAEKVGAESVVGTGEVTSGGTAGEDEGSMISVDSRLSGI